MRVSIYIFINLYITAQSDPAILVVVFMCIVCLVCIFSITEGVRVCVCVLHILMKEQSELL